MRNVYKCIQDSRHLENVRQVPLHFYSQKSQHFTLRNYHDIIIIGIYIYTERTIFCVTWRFYILKAKLFERSKTIFVTFFFEKKLNTLCYAIFHEIFESWQRGGDILKTKIMHLAINLHRRKNIAVSVTF